MKPWQYIVFEMALDLTHLPAPSHAAAQTELERQGLAITTLAAAVERDREAARLIYDLHNECHLLQPPAEANRAPIPFHLWLWGSVEARGEALPEAYFLAMDGERYVGLSSAVRVPRLASALQSRFTGVRGAYQGRGIARALKVATIGYAATHGYSELRSIVLAENAPMLHINQSLGFVCRRQFVQSYPQAQASKRFNV